MYPIVEEESISIEVSRFVWRIQLVRRDPTSTPIVSNAR